MTHSSLVRLDSHRDRLHEAARFLLESGADPNQTFDSRSPLFGAESDPSPLSPLYGAAGVNFDPDMTRLLDYADYYADLMYRNGMDAINFDGFESTVYQNHGYYAVRIFCRRLFETYARLSGGNIQKVLLARELAEGAKVVIFNKPTYGLDLANTLASRQRIRDTAARGLAVLLISTDLEELLSMCDRIAVIAKGALVGAVENSDDARTKVGRLMIGLAA